MRYIPTVADMREMRRRSRYSVVLPGVALSISLEALPRMVANLRQALSQTHAADVNNPGHFGFAGAPVQGLQVVYSMRIRFPELPKNQAKALRLFKLSEREAGVSAAVSMRPDGSLSMFNYTYNTNAHAPRARVKKNTWHLIEVVVPLRIGMCNVELRFDGRNMLTLQQSLTCAVDPPTTITLFEADMKYEKSDKAAIVSSTLASLGLPPTLASNSEAASTSAALPSPTPSPTDAAAAKSASPSSTSENSEWLMVDEKEEAAAASATSSAGDNASANSSTSATATAVTSAAAMKESPYLGVHIRDFRATVEQYNHTEENQKKKATRAAAKKRAPR